MELVPISPVVEGRLSSNQLLGSSAQHLAEWIAERHMFLPWRLHLVQMSFFFDDEGLPIDPVAELLGDSPKCFLMCLHSQRCGGYDWIHRQALLDFPVYNCVNNVESFWDKANKQMGGHLTTCRYGLLLTKPPKMELLTFEMLFPGHA